MRLKDILAFAKERVSFKHEKPKKIKMRWSFHKVPVDDLERLKGLALSSTHLTSLMQHPGWKEILDAKVYYQQSALNGSLSVELGGNADLKRLMSAQQHQTLEGFFTELSLRIKRGNEAKEKLDALSESI